MSNTSVSAGYRCGTAYQCLNYGCPERKPVSADRAPTCYTCGKSMSEVQVPTEPVVTFRGIELQGHSGVASNKRLLVPATDPGHPSPPDGHPDLRNPDPYAPLYGPAFSTTVTV